MLSTADDFYEDSEPAANVDGPDKGPAAHDEPSDYAQLTQAWLNERFAPEILPYEETLVDHLQELVKAQALNIERQRRREHVDTAFRLMLYQQEIERVKHVLRAYIRTRMAKIEEQALFVQASEHVRARLSPMEQEYAAAYADMYEHHMQASGLSSLPRSLQTLTENSDLVNMVPEPDLDSGVFAQVLQPIGDVETAGNETIQLDAGDIHLLRYIYIRRFLVEGDAQTGAPLLRLI